MKRLALAALSLIVILSYGLVISQYRPPILESELKPENPSGYYDYKGVTHSHSSLNRGSLPPEQIIKQAESAQLDFLFLTDLNYFDEYPIQPGYFGNVLVMTANTYSYLDSYLIYYSLDSPNFSGLGDVQIFLSDYLSKPTLENGKDFLVLAHPFKGRENWSGSYPEGITGIETVNLKSIWKSSWEQTRISFLWSTFIYPFNSHLSLLRLFHHPEKEFKLWDDLNAQRATIGFVGNETTSRAFPVGRNLFRFPSYQTSFEIATNHVLLKSELTGDTEKDQLKIFNALRSGQFYMSLDYLENPKGFSTFIRSEAREYPLGSRLEYNAGQVLYVSLPKEPKVPYETVFLKNGRAVKKANEQHSSLEIDGPGTYRVMVRAIPTMPLPDGKKWIPWIYTNPFFVR